MKMITERRAEQRKTAGIPAFLDLLKGEAPRPCFVSDISDMGALVLIDGDERLIPDRLFLWMTKDGKVKRRCVVAWRRVGQIGIRFHDGP